MVDSIDGDIREVIIGIRKGRGGQPSRCEKWRVGRSFGEET